MAIERNHCLHICTLTLAVGMCVGALGSCGCRGEEKEGSIEDLFIGRYRYNIDKNQSVVRVVGEVENKGSALVKAVEVHAILHSSGGSRRGMNMIVLKDIAPGELRTFSLTVTSHGRTSTVQLELAEAPGPP